MSGLNPARLAREFPLRYRLEAARCRACGQVSAPRRAVCPACRGHELETVVLPDRGTVESFTVVHVGPAAFSLDTPYALAVVALGDGIRITTQLADVEPAEVRVGMAVRLEFRRLAADGQAGVIAYAHKAVPA